VLSNQSQCCGWSEDRHSRGPGWGALCRILPKLANTLRLVCDTVGPSQGQSRLVNACAVGIVAARRNGVPLNIA
jgi:hypothetical protein